MLEMLDYTIRIGSTPTILYLYFLLAVQGKIVNSCYLLIVTLEWKGQHQHLDKVKYCL